MKESKVIGIKIELEGYEEVKNQLTEIENQIDRIIKKGERLKDKTIRCSECGITVIEKVENRTNICLPLSKIKVVKGCYILDCNCGNKIIVDAYTLKCKKN